MHVRFCQSCMEMNNCLLIHVAWAQAFHLFLSPSHYCFPDLSIIVTTYNLNYFSWDTSAGIFLGWIQCLSHFIKFLRPPRNRLFVSRLLSILFFSWLIQSMSKAQLRGFINMWLTSLSRLLVTIFSQKLPVISTVPCLNPAFTHLSNNLDVTLDSPLALGNDCLVYIKSNHNNWIIFQEWGQLQSWCIYAQIHIWFTAQVIILYLILKIISIIF